MSVPPILSDQDKTFYAAIHLHNADLEGLRMRGWGVALGELSLLITHPVALERLSATEVRVLRHIYDKRRQLAETLTRDAAWSTNPTITRCVIQQQVREESPLLPALAPQTRMATRGSHARIAKRRTPRTLLQKLLASTRALRIQMQE